MSDTVEENKMSFQGKVLELEQSIYYLASALREIECHLLDTSKTEEEAKSAPEPFSLESHIDDARSCISECRDIASRLCGELGVDKK